MAKRIVCLLAALSAALGGAAAAQDDDVARMEAEHAGDSPLASPAAEELPAAPVEADPIAYATLDGASVTGYLALPASGEVAAGVLLIHEWWGLNDNIRAMAERFAGEGYAALAVDLYEGEAAQDREGASRLARAASGREERLVENLGQAAAFLRDQVGVGKLGVVGWCFGGSWSLRAALELPAAIDATVVYYGRVPGEAAALATLDAPVLGHFGSEDGGIPPSAARAFEAALAEVGIEHAVHIYEGADHAFANPSGTRYDEAAASAAWERTLAFFERHLR